MGFADRYVMSLNSSNLMDDGLHHATEALAAAALADMTGAGLGALLSRVKYTSGARKGFEAGSANLAHLLRIWTATVTEKGRSRGWYPIRAEWDIVAANKLYSRAAELSLAHFLDGNCEACGGTGISAMRLTCKACEGAGLAPIKGARYEVERATEMLGELHGLVDAHNARAGARMRRVE